MQQNRQLEWLLDDWHKALRRSLVRGFSRRQLNALRWQWRIGQAVKGVLLVGLPLLFTASLLVPDADEVLLELLMGWSGVEGLLLLGHVGLGLRHNVSYSWSLHHRQPRLLHGLVARQDLRWKGFAAAVCIIVALLCLIALA